VDGPDLRPSAPRRAITSKVERALHVEMVGHATLRIHAGGKTLLTDPWLVDPICAGSCFHFPPPVHDLAELAAATDAIHLSHPHPDHFHPPTLAAFPRHVPIYVGRYARKDFRDAVRALGFRVIEAPFGETMAIADTPIEITPLEHDVVADGYDSALVVRTPAFTLFENNDCRLRPATYRWIRDRFAIDYAFLGYSPASEYPICFELSSAEKTRLLREAAERRFAELVEGARILAPGLTVPFANGMRFLVPRSQWRNAAFSSAAEAVRRVRTLGLAAEVMHPGDRLGGHGSVERGRAADEGDGEDEPAALAAHARTLAGWLGEIERRAPRPADDLVERFRDHVLRLWRAARARRPDVRRQVIAYELVGGTRASFFFDFTRRDDEIFARGAPPRYDMRYRYPAAALQMALDGAIGWEELHFANDVSIHQVVYAEDFCAMLFGGVS
jgi:Beta-lactamase superfamily domain